MEFFQITPYNIAEIEKYLKKQPYRSSNYTIGAIYSWREYFNYEYCVVDETLIIKGVKNDGIPHFLFPIGDNIINAFHRIDEYCANNNIDLIFSQVPEEALGILKEHYDVKIKLSTNWFDYLYDIEKLSTLSGKKLAAKRNHTNFFEKHYSNYKFKPITETDIPRLIEFMDEFKQIDKAEDQIELAEFEEESCYDAINNYFLENQVGAFIEIDNKIIAYTIGEVINDTLYVHIEKANRDYHGSYAIINRDFCKYIKSLYQEVLYVNREEDVGDIGLRKAKQSYHPIKLLQKYTVKVEE